MRRRSNPSRPPIRSEWRVAVAQWATGLATIMEVPGSIICEAVRCPSSSWPTVNSIVDVHRHHRDDRRRRRRRRDEVLWLAVRLLFPKFWFRCTHTNSCLHPCIVLTMHPTGPIWIFRRIGALIPRVVLRCEMLKSKCMSRVFIDTVTSANRLSASLSFQWSPFVVLNGSPRWLFYVFPCFPCNKGCCWFLLNFCDCGSENGWLIPLNWMRSSWVL